MKIVIAPDKFKGTLSASQAAEAIAAGISSACDTKGKSACEIIIAPMADGGEGSLGLITGSNGSYRQADSCDALLRPIETFYGVADINGKKTAIIEAASTVGLFRLSEQERNPMKTTSYGLGVMILDAIRNGYGNIAVTVGGTATNDCGTGMLAALGCLFYDHTGRIIENPTGANLSEIHDIDISPISILADKYTIKVLCDVDNPLLGTLGAAAVFSPQKGADSEMVAKLEQGAKELSETSYRITGVDFANIPGAGAGGGITWALKTFCGAEIVNGAEFIAGATGLDLKIKNADLVITGEGSFDSQSLHGKVAGFVASTAKKHGVPVVVLCGRQDGTATDKILDTYGISGVFALTDRVSTKQAQENASEELTHMAFDVFNCKIATK